MIGLQYKSGQCGYLEIGSESNNYSVTLKITDSNCVCLALKQVRLCLNLCKMKEESITALMSCWSLQLFYRRGRSIFLEASMGGPPSWYEQGGSSHVKHPRVTFTFANAEGVVEQIPLFQMVNFLNLNSQQVKYMSYCLLFTVYCF